MTAAALGVASGVLLLHLQYTRPPLTPPRPLLAASSPSADALVGGAVAALDSPPPAAARISARRRRALAPRCAADAPRSRDPPPGGGLASLAAHPRLLLALCACAYGTNYPTIKLIDEMAGPASGAALRFTVAALIMLPALWALGEREPRLVSGRFALASMEPGVWFALGYVAQAQALDGATAAGLTAFLCSLSVVVCPLLECALLGRSQPATVWAAAGLATLGVGALELGAAGHGAGLSSLTHADLLGLLQPLFFGLGFFRLERAMAAHGGAGADGATGGMVGGSAAGAPRPAAASWWAPFALTAWQILIIWAMMAAWAVADLGGVAPLLDELSALLARGGTELPLAVLWTGLVTTALASFLEATALGEISASAATVVYATEPLWGSAFAYAVLGERLGPTAALGGALIVLACGLSGYKGADEPAG